MYSIVSAYSSNHISLSQGGVSRPKSKAALSWEVEAQRRSEKAWHTSNTLRQQQVGLMLFTMEWRGEN